MPKRCNQLYSHKDANVLLDKGSMALHQAIRSKISEFF